MHKRTIDAFNSGAACQRPASSSTLPSCPVPHNSRSESPGPATHPTTFSRLNPLNYMFRDLSQAPAPHQPAPLPIEREASTIPKGSGDGNWEYPSPQQMYNALLRKGYTDTDVTAVESMVAVHNFLNEGAWNEINEWERRFGRGLVRGWDICKKGEQNAALRARELETKEGCETKPALVRFQGRPKDMTPKAAMIQVMGWLYPSTFG